ncbi:kinase-like domain-containing protein [Lentinula raphanica]|nr:kinase-like domain-containing protein [Lentinula raphanica]
MLIDTFGRWIYVKHELNGYKIEYNNLKFLHDHSQELQIPVPRPYLSLVFQHHLWPYHGEYIFMTRLHGRDLHELWLNLSHPEKYKIVSQLRSYMLNLRSMKTPPETMIGSFHGGPVGCYRLLQFDVVGPFLDESHFNRHLRGPLAPSSLSSTVLESHQKRHDLCATHNDLFPRNILVDADLNVIGVVDWKSSGWFPAHWEYCICRNWAYDKVDQDWKKWIHEVLDSWAEEEIADHELMRAYPNRMVYWSTRLNVDSEDGYELYYHTRD